MCGYMVPRLVLLQNTRGVATHKLLYWSIHENKHARSTPKRARGCSTRAPSRARNAAFLPGFLAYCLSEGDLWFTSDNRTIILCAHSLLVDVKMQKRGKMLCNIDMLHHKLVTTCPRGERPEKCLGEFWVVKRFVLNKTYGNHFSKYKETVLAKSVLLL